jgi:integrase
MAVRERGKGFQIEFQWKGNRLFGACPVTSRAEALKIEKSLKTAFKIYRFDHLEPTAMEVVLGIFKSKGWTLPPELQVPDPKEELTLLDGIEDYLKAYEKNRRERKLFAVDHLVKYFGEDSPLAEITVSKIRRYRNHRLAEGVSNATVNIEVSTLSGIFREQLEQMTLELNPCSMVPRLPEMQRDTYVSWQDFQSMLEKADWLRPMMTLLYYTGMRPSEVFDLDWAEVNFASRMIILPPNRTKEGKNQNQKALRNKRIPMRREVHDLLWSMRHEDGNVVKMSGRVFLHKGSPITRNTKRKCWARLCRLTGLQGIQLRDLRHTFKTNAAMSGMERTLRNAIVGHATKLPVEDLYIHISDAKLLEAVDTMTFDHGTTAAHVDDGEKSPVKITSERVEKKKGHVPA